MASKALECLADARRAQADDAEASLVVGAILAGKYRIDALVGEGGMGVVTRATHLELGREVAIKFIRPEQVANEQVVARLLAEARIAASLRSKHVNRVIDVGRTAAGVPFLVLEYLEGSDLGCRLDEVGPLPVVEAVDHVLSVCEALAEAHALGIVHRDLKPENLFLSEEPDGELVLKVLDFGISKAPAPRRGHPRVSNPFELIGSPTYMSPEQIRCENVDARSDIWALGVVLHELCTAEVLFEAPSPSQIFARILDERWLPRPFGSGPEAQHVQRVIAKCLCRNPDGRYQHVVELAQDLSALGSDALQAARVARVAAVQSRHRAGDAAGPVLMAPPTRLALATQSFEWDGVPADVTRASRWPWLVIGTLGAVVCVGAIRFRTQLSPLDVAWKTVAARSQLLVNGREPSGLVGAVVSAPPQVVAAPLAATPAAPLVVAVKTYLPCPAAQPWPPVAPLAAEARQEPEAAPLAPSGPSSARVLPVAAPSVRPALPAATTPAHAGPVANLDDPEAIANAPLTTPPKAEPDPGNPYADF